MKFRDRKESIEESLRTQIEVNSKQELINHIENNFKEYNKKVTLLKFKHIGFNDLIKQECYNVIVQFNNNEAENIVGISDDVF